MVWPITAADVRTELGAGWADPPPGTDPLEVYAAAAVERIEAEIGPRSGQSLTTTVPGPRDVVVTAWAFEALVSVSVEDVLADLATFTPTPDAGIVTGVFGPGAVVVTTTAPTTVPQVVELAARYLAATWVRQSKVGPPRSTSRGGDPDTDVLQGFAMPRRVSEMIRPYIPVWGFA